MLTHPPPCSTKTMLIFVCIPLMCLYYFGALTAVREADCHGCKDDYEYHGCEANYDHHVCEANYDHHSCEADNDRPGCKEKKEAGTEVNALIICFLLCFPNGFVLLVHGTPPTFFSLIRPINIFIIICLLLLDIL